MKTKLFNVLGIMVLMLALLPGQAYASTAIDYEPVDVGPQIRAQEFSPDLIVPPDSQDLAGELAAGEALAAESETDCITDTKYYLILNDYTGRYQVNTFNKMGAGDLSEVWVQTDLAWTAGDTRELPVVTCSQVSYLIGEFESNIYPTEIDFFGAPTPHDGTLALLPGMLGLPADYYADPAGKQIVLVSNIRDDNYYNPAYPSYIAGFYSPTFELYFDRNIMSIDAYDWANRVGPDGARPHMYEGVFAHEYQHLLHDDYDSDEENWINEGMADFAEEITGYEEGLDSHLKAAAANPENSLTQWEDQGGLEILTDYGQAYLFQHFLSEKFGRSFIQALFRNQDNSITSVNSSLKAAGIRTNFAKIFHDWSVAMVIDSATPAGGRYQFKDIDFKLNLGTPAEPNTQAYDTPGAPPWGNDYIWITGDPKKLSKIVFDGVELSVLDSAWTVDEESGMLWGGAGDLLDNWAIFPAAGGGVLTFDTAYDMEELWDFGFVQVSTDNGATWTSLANGYTISENDPNAHPKVIANLPGLTGLSDLVTMSFDLSAYAGQDVLIGFRCVTDWATSYGGWYIDNVTYNGQLISDGTSMEPFKDLTAYQPIKNDFSVIFIGMKSRGKGNQNKVLEMRLSEMKQKGLFELNKVLKDSTSVVMLVSLEAQEDSPFYADYTYEFIQKTPGPRKNHAPRPWRWQMPRFWRNR